jgi:hypothetical protein
VSGRGPGWPTVLGLALVAITFPVVNPLHLVVIPLALLLVALPPRTPGLLVLAAALGLLSFTGPRGELWAVERGWSLLLGSWFVLMILLWPRASVTARVVAATGAAAVSAAALVMVQGGWPVLDHMVAVHYEALAAAVGRTWPGGGVDPDVVRAWTAEVATRLFPALTAIGSMAALGVAWWVFGRITGRPRPLGSLVEFRFPDPLVWVLIAALALMLVPVATWAVRLGLNLAVVMGALYALRGFAVTVALILGMIGPRVGVLVALGLVGVILYPIVVAGTLLLGVTDTWLDLRSGRRAENDGG